MPQIQTLVKRLKPNFGTAVQLEACGQLCEQLFQKENPPLGAVVAAGAVEDPDRPFRVLLADGVEQRVEGERIEIHRDGALVERRRLPWAERLARRFSIWWRRRGLGSPDETA